LARGRGCGIAPLEECATTDHSSQGFEARVNIASFPSSDHGLRFADPGPKLCLCETHFHLSRLDDSNEAIIDHHLKMTPAERFADLMARVDFHDRVQRERSVENA
jgi:hypothetical protein